MKNQYLLTIMIALVVGGASFYGGMLYQMKKASPMGSAGPMVRQMGQGGRKGERTTMQFKGPDGATAFRPVAGEILSKDDTSITVKTADGSSKIIILSEKTTVNKTSEASKSDLTTGENVSIMGTANSDGSITAQNISLGNQMFTMMGATASPSAIQP